MRGLQIPWLLANPSWLTAWAVKTAMTPYGLGMERMTNQVSWVLTNT